MSGTSGSASIRLALVTAIARSLPARMCSIDDESVSNSTVTCPDSMSISAGPEPRYGMCCMVVPVIALNNSVARCADVPLPAEA